MNYKVYSWATLSLSALLMFSACANDDIANSENEVTLNGHKLNITINEETFEAEKPTRAAQVLHRDTIDMGDGLIAVVTIEPDKTAPTPQPAKTRAAMSEGHYTIYAVDAAGNRVADELSGTVSNGKFIPDVNKRIRLDPGTYTFVCHNDAFTKTATGLDIKGSMFDGFKDCPMVGTVTKTLSGGVETVAFNMKHFAARTRVQITTYTSYPKIFEGTSTYIYAHDPKFSTMHFDKIGNLTSRDVGPTAYTWDSFDKFQHVGNKPFSSIVEPFETISSQYTYIALAEGENIPANSLVFKVFGSYYGKTSKQLDININAPLERNHTYLVKATVKTKDPLYLYQDGTVGYLGDKETRTPIALVVTEKTATEKGMAIALNRSMGGSTMMVQDLYSGQFRFHNDDGTVNNMEGYEITYTTNYYNSAAIASRGGQVPTVPPSELDPSYAPTIYWAAHYQPAGVTTYGANVGKWFLPSAGQMKLFLERYGEAKDSDMPTHFNNNMHTYTNGVDYNHDKIDKAFTAAGGIAFSLPIALSGTDGHNHPVNVTLHNNKIYWTYDDSFIVFMNVLECRPFVFF